MKTTGIVLLIIGIVFTVITSFKFFTKEKVVDLGPVEISREKPHTFDWSPILGIAIMGIGGVLLIQNNRKN